MLADRQMPNICLQAVQAAELHPIPKDLPAVAIMVLDFPDIQEEDIQAVVDIQAAVDVTRIDYFIIM